MLRAEPITDFTEYDDMAKDQPHDRGDKQYYLYDDDLVGYFTTIRFQEEDCCAYMYIKPEHRGKGYYDELQKFANDLYVWTMTYKEEFEQYREKFEAWDYDYNTMITTNTLGFLRMRR